MQSPRKPNLRMIIFVVVSITLLVVGSALWIRWVKRSSRSGRSYDLQDWIADSRARALAATPEEYLEDVRWLIDHGCFIDPEKGIASCSAPGVLNGESLSVLARCKFVRAVIVFGQQLDGDLTPLTELPQLDCAMFRRCTAPWGAFWPLGDIKTLRRLHIASSYVCDEDLKHILGKIELTDLGLSYNSDVTEVGLEALQDVVTLQTLDLNNTSVGKLDFVRRLAELQELQLSATLMNDENLAPLTELPKLEVLDLSCTSVSDKAIVVIAQIRTLREVNLMYTAVTQAGKEQLQQSLPTASIWVGRQ